jgi:hypothetical protein
MTTLLLSMAFAVQCETYSVKCKCGPSTPFEGFQIYVVEKCNKEEAWYADYGQQQYSAEHECKEAIPTDQVCRNLPK